MKFFVDTADVKEIKELNDVGLLDGVTTNPSLILKSGRNILEVTKEICDIVEGPVSCEVTATEYNAMMKEAELVVFWSADPETTSGSYAAHEGTIRRLWLNELGIEVVHIDPYYNNSAALLGGKWLAPRPGTDTAMALAIAYVWLKEGLYDKKFCSARSVGFEVWADYVLGKEDGIAKTP